MRVTQARQTTQQIQQRNYHRMQTSQTEIQLKTPPQEETIAMEIKIGQSIKNMISTPMKTRVIQLMQQLQLHWLHGNPPIAMGRLAIASANSQTM